MKTYQLQAILQSTIQNMKEIINTTEDDMTRIKATEALGNAVQVYMELADPKLKMNMNMKPVDLEDVNEYVKKS